MKSSDRYVFDTNVIISALLFEQSNPGKAFYAALDRGEILFSLPVLKELNEVLSRKNSIAIFLEKSVSVFLLHYFVRQNSLIRLRVFLYVVTQRMTNSWSLRLVVKLRVLLVETRTC